MELLYSFRPLPGSFLFHHSAQIGSSGDSGFRPLPGSFLFHQLTFNEKTEKTLVSVPCRGLFYFIRQEKIRLHSLTGFRPLPGSFLFHLSCEVKFCEEVSKFPSPAGVFFISSMGLFEPSLTATIVSVPCRGLFYFIPVPDIPVYIRGYQLICGVKI